MNEDGIRLNRFMSEAGLCSRREADRKIEAGEVTVDGKIATLGTRVYPGQKVVADGRVLKGKAREVILLVNKPKGIVCTAEKSEPDNIVDYIDYPVRIYPVGRLDKDSHGLIVMTNNGDIVNRMMRSGNHHEKEYHVRVDKPVTEEFLKAMRTGVWLNELEVKTRPCKVEKNGERTFTIVLTQGLNRQIRRMCEALGYRVRDLVRTRVMNLTLSGIPEGGYREITPEEHAELMKLIRNSPSESQYAAEKRNTYRKDKNRRISKHYRDASASAAEDNREKRSGDRSAERNGRNDGSGSRGRSYRNHTEGRNQNRKSYNHKPKHR